MDACSNWASRTVHLEHIHAAESLGDESTYLSSPELRMWWPEMRSEERRAWESLKYWSEILEQQSQFPNADMLECVEFANNM